MLVALGRDPRYLMDQLGHTDPQFTMRVYAHGMRFSEDERARLRALVDGPDWAATGSGSVAKVVVPDRVRTRTRG